MRISSKLGAAAALLMVVMLVVNMLEGPVLPQPPPVAFTPPSASNGGLSYEDQARNVHVTAKVAAESRDSRSSSMPTEDSSSSMPADDSATDSSIAAPEPQPAVPFTFQQPPPHVFSLPETPHSIQVLRQRSVDRSPTLHSCAHASEDGRIVDVSITADQVSVTIQALASVRNLDLIVTPLVLGAASLPGNATIELLGMAVQADSGDVIVVQVRVPQQVYRYQHPMPLTAKQREAQLRKFYYDPARFPYPWAGDGGSSNANDRNACMDFFGRALLGLPQPLMFAELGSGTGGMLAYIATIVKELSPESYVLTVEFERSRHEAIRAAMTDIKLNDRLLYFTGDVTKLNWNYGPIGAIFADVNSWMPTADALVDLTQYLVVGGYIGFHDTFYSDKSYDNYRNGIKRLLDTGQFQVVNSGYLYVLQKVGRRSASSIQSLRVVSKVNGHRHANEEFGRWKIASSRPADMMYSSADCVELDMSA